jgi:hypothetical protein
MTGNYQIFHEINTSFETNVRMENDALVQAKGKGNIAVHMKMGSRVIKDVLLVLDLKQNLLSVRATCSNYYAIHFEKHGCKIIDRHGQLSASIGMEENRNFALQLKHTPHLVLQAETIDESVL